MNVHNDTRPTPMVYVHLNDHDKAIMARLIREPRKPKQLAESLHPHRPYISERLKRMIEHEWVVKKGGKSSGLYVITPLGRRKYAELKELDIETIEEFVQIYGAASLLVVLTHIDSDGNAESIDALSEIVDVRPDHLAIILDILADALGENEDNGARERIAEWIAPAEQLDEAAIRSRSANDHDGVQNAAD